MLRHFCQHFHGSLIHGILSRFNDWIQNANHRIKGQHAGHCSCTGFGRSLHLQYNIFCKKTGTVFENRRKSLTSQHCERSELRLHIGQKWSIWREYRNTIEIIKLTSFSSSRCASSTLRIISSQKPWKLEIRDSCLSISVNAPKTKARVEPTWSLRFSNNSLSTSL